MEDIKISELDYRGLHLDFYTDDEGQQVYTYIDNECICFGAYNMSFIDDAKYLINRRLDTIYVFDDPYFGAQLVWFDNEGYRDIKLIYRGRIIKIFLVADESKANTDRLITDSKIILSNIKKYSKN